MKKENLEQLSDDELRATFRKHNIRGVIISLTLLIIFLFFYLVPLGIRPGDLNIIFISLMIISLGFALWYNISKRKYFSEFKRRETSF